MLIVLSHRPELSVTSKMIDSAELFQKELGTPFCTDYKISNIAYDNNFGFKEHEIND